MWLIQRWTSIGQPTDNHQPTMQLSANVWPTLSCFLGPRTLYSLINTGVHGSNGLNPIKCLTRSTSAMLYLDCFWVRNPTQILFWSLQIQNGNISLVTHQKIFIYIFNPPPREVNENMLNIEERLSLARRTPYSLINTGVHGSNRQP